MPVHQHGKMVRPPIDLSHLCSTPSMNAHVWMQDVPYTSLTLAKSPMSTSKTVVFRTWLYEDPAASKMAPKFLSACSVCSSMPSPTKFFVPGTRGTWPET